MFFKAGFTKLGHLIDFNLFSWKASRVLTPALNIRSERFLEKVLSDLQASLCPALSQFLSRFLAERVAPEQEPLFPAVLVSPSVTVEEEEEPAGNLLSLRKVTEVAFHTIEKKALYEICVKTRHFNKLKDLVDTKWRAHLSVPVDEVPAWRVLYKLPLPKRSGDLQWRVLHGIFATNRYLSRVEPGVSVQCPFCPAEETVFHLFVDCPRLQPFFLFLENLLASLGVTFTKTFFVFSVKYSFARRDRCSLVNFVLGQAKLAILKSRKNKILATGFINPISVFRILMVSRIKMEFAYFKMVHDLDNFERRWCIGEGVCAVTEEGQLVMLL